MGLSRKSSSANTPSLAKAQPSNSHLNNLGKTSTPTTNGTVAPAIAGHDKIHSTNTSTPSSPAGSIGSGADGKELKFLDHTTGSNSNGPQSPDKAAAAAAPPRKNQTRNLCLELLECSRNLVVRRRNSERKRRNLNGENNILNLHIPEPTSPMARHSEKDGEYSSDTDGGQSRGSSVAGDHPPKSKNVSGQHKNGEGHMIRFEMLEDGVNHVHHLRAAKRQEKLSTLLQSWLGGGQKKKDDEGAPSKDQLSLTAFMGGSMEDGESGCYKERWFTASFSYIS